VSGPAYPRVAAFKTAGAFRSHLRALGLALDLDDAVENGAASPLAQPFELGDVRVGNRFCILPMEGWDGTSDGAPSDLTRRRWRHFGVSGAKLIWGGEAVAVRQDGRANPNQLLLTPVNAPAIAELREGLVAAHRERFGSNADGDLYIGLQLTHSGRYARPSVSKPGTPLAGYAHPILDRRFPGGVRVLADEEIDRLIADFAAAAKLAWNAGFAFIDVKQCHGYLGHELLSARDRPGRYGGSLENRTRFLRSVIDAIRSVAPRMVIGVRLSVFDTVPFRKNPDGLGEPEPAPADYHAALGLLCSDLHRALDDAREVIALLERLGVRWISVSAGSPYYNPHVQRPALFPPSDGYLPPEDPLAGVARQIDATARLKADFPSMVFVGCAYSYLQEWLPHVAQRAVRLGMTDFVGLGRMVLAYPELPADVLAGKPLQRKRICRTFSDCTTGPRLGLVSGCYPLDDFYKNHPHAVRLKEMKVGS
jgi:2,4-dienoyl-CoA reductase-like NADH-dependent reductase (Old Yellow Enzyme family)